MRVTDMCVCAIAASLMAGCLTTMGPTELDARRREAQYLRLKAEAARRMAEEKRLSAESLKKQAEETRKQRNDFLLRAKRCRRSPDPDERRKARYFEENAHRLGQEAVNLRRSARDARSMANAKDLQADQLQSKAERMAKKVQQTTEELRKKGIRTSADLPK